MTILVTGGAGYIGSHTVKHLKNSGHRCVVLDNLVYGHKEAVCVPDFEQGDLLDQGFLASVFQKYQFDAVVHFAAYAYVGESVENPQKYYTNNVVGTLNLLNAMMEAGVKKIVFSSTCATYGNPVYIPLDEKHIQNPINPYGQSKLIVEKILADYLKAYGLKYIALRYFNAAGASTEGEIGECHHPETHLIPLVLKTITGKRKAITVFGNDYNTPDGTCIRDYIHVEDLAAAHQAALEKLDTHSGCINLGTGVGTSVEEVIKAAEQVTGLPCPTEYAPRRPGDPEVLYAANDMAKRILGWSPQYTKIEDIIGSAWIWEQKSKWGTA
jgi:UDP-glucose 4-epimerase